MLMDPIGFAEQAVIITRTCMTVDFMMEAQFYL
jgi:hypothetical protein